MGFPSPADAAPGDGGDRPGRAGSLYVEYQKRLRAFLLGVLHNQHLVEEALQNTFRKAIETGGADVQAADWSWLSRVAFNEAMLLRRKQGVHDRAVQSLAWQTSVSETPSDSLVSAETAARVQEALSRLPPEQQRIVRLRIYEDLTFAEIASQEGIAINTALTRMRLALDKLRKSLND